MSQTQAELDKVRVARECREIRRLNGHLEKRALQNTRDASNNDALNMLAPAASLTKWQEKYAKVEHEALENDDPHWHEKTGGSNYANDQLEEHHPLLVAAYWEDVIRAKLGTPTDRRATVTDALNFIVSALDWMYDDDLYGNPNFGGTKKLKEDLIACRIRLENILKDGIRHEKTETPCDEQGCTKQLVKIYRDNAAHDYYQCPTHRQHIDYPRFVAITHQHLFSANADDTWIDVAAAAKSINRSKAVIHNWMKPARSAVVPFHGRKVRSRRVGPMRKLQVYWADVRDADNAAKRKLAERKMKEAS